jgi:hypothetical protein
MKCFGSLTILFLLSGAIFACRKSDTESQMPKDTVVTPSAKAQEQVHSSRAGVWSAYYVEIDKAASEVGMPALYKSNLGGNDIEIRFWRFPGASYIACFRLQKKDDKWQAWGVGVDLKVSEKFIIRSIPETENRWSALWNKLNSNGVLQISDCFDLVGGIDTTSYVIETLYDNHYRTVVYNFPLENKCADSAKVMNLYKILNEE